jgi:hypothetical protein
MARDYTKYSVKGLGENLNKRQLVFKIVKDYVEKNNPSFDKITSVFKDEIQGSKGFIKKLAKVKDPKRFNIKIPLKIKYGVEVVVSNQWGSENINVFLVLAKKLKYKVTSEQPVAAEKDDSNNTRSIQVSKEVSDLISEASPYELDEILAKVLNKEEVISLDFLPYLREVIEFGEFCGVELSEDYFDSDQQIEFCNDKITDILSEAEEKTEGYGDINEYKEEWGKLLNIASSKSDGKSIEYHMHIAKQVNPQFEITPFTDFGDLRVLADKHFQKAIDHPEIDFSDIKELLSLLDSENYVNDSLFEKCLNIGFEHANNFDHYFALCFNTDGQQIAKGNNFTKALDGCKANLSDALEYSIDEISMLNKFLPTIGYDPLEIPEKDTSNNYKVSLPNDLLSDWKLEWGSFININLQNGPEHETDNFTISLYMNERVIIGVDKDQEWGYDESKPSTKYFSDFAELWDQNLDDYASIANIFITDKFGVTICDVAWHTGLDYINDGELPEGMSEDIFESIFTGTLFSRLYKILKELD